MTKPRWGLVLHAILIGLVTAGTWAALDWLWPEVMTPFKWYSRIALISAIAWGSGAWDR